MKFLIAIVFAFIVFGCNNKKEIQQSKKETTIRPNIVYIMADDMGYGDVKSFGLERNNIPTPNMDKLASEGMRFTNALSTASVCVPSRMSIISGRYPFRFKKWSNKVGGKWGNWGFMGPVVPDTTFSIADLMKESGYATNYIGKWHLGLSMTTIKDTVQTIGTVDYTKPFRNGPLDLGFDESFILPGSLDMYPYIFAKNNEWIGKLGESKGWSAFNRVGPTAEHFADTLVLDTFCKQAENYIDRFSVEKAKNKKPFFMFVSLTSPHTPLAVSSKFKGKSPIGLYGDFVMETDHSVGRIVNALEKAGLSDNTMVIVTSDHGPGPYAGRRAKSTKNQLFEMERKDGHFARGPFRGAKFSIYEGGFRVPFIVKWPGIVKAKSSSDKNISLMDLMATFADMTDYELGDKGPDSFSFLPILKDPNAPSNRKTYIVESGNSYSIREGDWKLIMTPSSGTPVTAFWEIPPFEKTAWKEALEKYGKQPKNLKELESVEFVQLYNLSEDIGEQNNVAEDNPEKVKKLFSIFWKQVANGRTTEGEKLNNDWEVAPNFISPPSFVLNK